MTFWDEALFLIKNLILGGVWMGGFIGITILALGVDSIIAKRNAERRAEQQEGEE